MNRAQKKCFIVSAGLHLLLALILLIGPAFLSSGTKVDDRKTIDFIPLKTIDAAFSGGGSPKGGKPPPPDPQPQPKAQPQPQPPAPQPDPPKPIKPESESFDTKHTAKKLPSVSLKQVTRPKNPTSKQKPVADTDEQSRAADEQHKRFASAAKSAAQNLHASLSSSTSIELKGPGGGGVPYANFLDAVKKAYSDAWIVPDGVTDDEATGKASVTILRDGTVSDAHMIRSSGNALVDQSVEFVLRRVKFAAPLPDGAKEDQQTVTINFNVKAKRGTG